VRKHFEAMLLGGDNKTLVELAEIYDVVNIEAFEKHMVELADKSPNIDRQNSNYHFDAIVHNSPDKINYENSNYHFDAIYDKSMAYSQSMEFIDFFFSAESSNNNEDVSSAPSSSVEINEKEGNNSKK